MAKINLDQRILDETITLYFDLEQGKCADLEVAARAAIAFSQMVKEIAFNVDMGANLSIQLQSGTAGSLSLNAIIKFGKELKKKHPVPCTIICTILLWLANDARSWTTGKVLDSLRGSDAPAAVQTLTPQQQHDLAAEVAKMLKGGVGAQPRARIFSEAQNDSAIKGIGSTSKLGKRPEKIIPREKFPELSTITPSSDVDMKERQNKEILPVTIIRPYLKAKEAKWRFRYGTMPEFSATMRDKDFLKAMEDGGISFPLRVGSEMEIELVTEQVFKGGVWKIKSRTVTKVLYPKLSPSPLPLFKNYK